jgi:hypothetical protein
MTMAAGGPAAVIVTVTGPDVPTVNVFIALPPTGTVPVKLSVLVVVVEGLVVDASSFPHATHAIASATVIDKASFIDN